MPNGNRLTGTHFIRTTSSSRDDVDHHFTRMSDKMAVRRHALKLRYWPARVTTEASGLVVDMDWSMIQALKGLKIYELRIHETIGGHDNLRIIFYVGPPSPKLPKPCIWILSVFQKKRDDFTTVQLKSFQSRRLGVNTRFYAD